MEPDESQLHSFYKRLASIHRLKTIEGVLDWDQQVSLPDKAGDYRSEQLAHIASLHHQEHTDPKLFDLTEELHARIESLSPDDAVNVRETRKRIYRERKLPLKLVEEKARLTSETYQQWVAVRPSGDFKEILPLFKRLLAIIKEEAELTKVSDDLYDGLLDIYEPGGRIAELRPLLVSCAEKIAYLLPQILEKQIERVQLRGDFPKDAQEAICRQVASALGYDFTSGRLDTAPHPFQTTLGPYDFRITTRWNDDSPFPALYGVMHEVGHALYEMGTSTKWIGTPMGSPISLGIHESQSRFWENTIGRSRSFCQYLLPILQQSFRDLRGIDESAVWNIVNHVRPSLIRVEADEVTYTLHIVIRMDLEEQLIAGKLCVEDLPDAWNALYERYLGLTPEHNADGVLQDIHWYSGSIGYFPTYALGNLYGAAFAAETRRAIPSLDSMISAGEFEPILKWLNTNIHQHGMRYSGPELVNKLTGKSLSNEPFLKYIEDKFLA